MTWKEYVIEARRFDLTASWPAANRYVHAFTGILSDYGELIAATSPGNRIEEMGDVCWYLHILCDLAHVEDIETLSVEPAAKGPVFYDMANTAKRWFVAGKTPPEALLTQQVRNVITLLIDQSSGVNFHDMLAANIAKLNLRSGNKTKTYADTADEATRNRAAEAAIFDGAKQKP